MQVPNRVTPHESCCVPRQHYSYHTCNINSPTTGTKATIVFGKSTAYTVIKKIQLAQSSSHRLAKGMLMGYRHAFRATTCLTFHLLSKDSVQNNPN